jgi:hypothetical protein
MKLLTIFASAIFIFIALKVESQNQYPVALIPPALMENAVAVIRKDSYRFELHSPGNAVSRITYAVTVLKSSGDRYAVFSEYYDRSRTIRFIMGSVFDQFGNPVDKVKKSDLYDHSLNEYSFFSDDRMLSYTPRQTRYPYTVEYQYEVDFNDLMNYPTWRPVYYYDVSVESSELTVILMNNMDFRYKEVNLIEPVRVMNDGASRVYHWKCDTLRALKAEPYSPDLAEFTPVVYTAPVAFDYRGYKGNMDSWLSYGMWTNKLLIGRDTLPQKTIGEVRQLVAGIDDTLAMIRKIYEYAQSKTRYVSIQLGIGGFQPMEARKVDELGYGDCKALSNYVKALLKAAGIPSLYTEVRAGNFAMDLMTDFPSNQTNHIILCVPVGNDTVWLECTDQDCPVGYLGRFTDNRPVLLITQEGGKIARTRNYLQNENLQSRRADVDIRNDLSSHARIRASYSGIGFDDLAGILYKPVDEQKKWYENTLDFPGFSLGTFSHEIIKGEVPRINEQIEVELRDYCAQSGDRIFLTLNLMNKFGSVPEKCEDRKTDVVIRRGFIHTDTVVYHLPGNLVLEDKPKEVSLSSIFGEYHSNTSVDGDAILYTREFRVNAVRFDPSSYAILYDFLKHVYKADQAKAVLKKKI